MDTANICPTVRKSSHCRVTLSLMHSAKNTDNDLLLILYAFFVGFEIVCLFSAVIIIHFVNGWTSKTYTRHVGVYKVTDTSFWR